MAALKVCLPSTDRGEVNMTLTNKLLAALLGLVALVAVPLSYSALKSGDSTETYNLRVTTESTSAGVIRATGNGMGFCEGAKSHAMWMQAGERLDWKPRANLNAYGEVDYCSPAWWAEHPTAK